MAGRRLTLAFSLLIVVVAAACSSSYDDAQRSRPVYRGGTDSAGRGGVRAAAIVAGLDMVPPDDWWHDDTIATPVQLTTDQLQALDRIGHDQEETIAKLQRDTVVAVRDLRQQLDAEKPLATDIVAAGQRIRAMRDEMFDRQVKMLADERAVLTQTQWRALQDSLQSARRGRNEDGGYRRGGRGGFPGGRRPGRPF